jgi:hypothetical protein
MKFTVTIKGVNGKELVNACDQAQLTLAIQVMKDTVPFVPAKTGVYSSRARVDKNTVVYGSAGTDQTQYLWYGKVMVDEQGRHAVYYKDVGFRHRKGARLHPIDKDLVFTTDMHPNATSHWMDVSYEQNAERWAEKGKEAVLTYLGRTE